MAHAVPTALLTIRLARGRDPRCSHDKRLQPGLHPCQARQLLTSAPEDGAVDWWNEVVGVELGGPRLVDHQGGLHRAESDDGPRRCFATTLAHIDHPLGVVVAPNSPSPHPSPVRRPCGPPWPRAWSASCVMRLGPIGAYGEREAGAGALAKPT